MPLSQFIEQVQPSATMAISARAAAMKREGIDVIPLSAGEPDFDTPEHIKAAGIRAIEEGFTKYTSPPSGIVELKEAVCRKFRGGQRPRLLHRPGDRQLRRQALPLPRRRRGAQSRGRDDRADALLGHLYRAAQAGRGRVGGGANQAGRGPQADSGGPAGGDHPEDADAAAQQSVESERQRIHPG